VVLLREAGGASILAGQGDDCKIILGIGQPCGLRSKQRENLNVIAPAGLVAKGFQSDSGTRGGGEGLSDGALRSFRELGESAISVSTSPGPS
jgi:hypothetical protein